MRAAVVCCLVVAGAAAPAFAQESQQDIAERIVREQEDLRRRQVDKVMGAPARAWDHADADPYHPIDAFPEAKPPQPAAPAKKPSGPFPWLMVALLIPAVPLALLAFSALRRWARDGG